MSTFDTKLDSLCDNLEGCNLDGTAETKISDEELFKQPPLKGDCPICLLLLPTLRTGKKYKTCCGKVICSGCEHAPVFDDQGNKVHKKCPFCRVPHPKSAKEATERNEKRVEAGGSRAIYTTGCYYRDGANGYPQNYIKALEYWHRASKLGSSEAYSSIGYAYSFGEGVEVDKKKGKYYYCLAATRGHVTARYNLAANEYKTGNMERAAKHLIIATRSGHPSSLKRIQHLYSNGHVTKDDYTKALRSYQEYLGEIKSKQRDDAAAAHENYRYY